MQSFPPARELLPGSTADSARRQFCLYQCDEGSQAPRQRPCQGFESGAGSFSGTQPPAPTGFAQAVPPLWRSRTAYPSVSSLSMRRTTSIWNDSTLEIGKAGTARAVGRGKSGQQKSLRPLPCPGMNVAGLPLEVPVATATRRRVFDLQVPLTLAVPPPARHALAQ